MDESAVSISVPSLQNGGVLWPSERPKMRVARPQQDARLGNISLIPLRGNESEMRNSVAAFATDPLTVSDPGPLDGSPCGAAFPLHHMMGGSWSPNLGGGYPGSHSCSHYL